MTRAVESPIVRANVRKCSLCHHTGHTKRKCPRAADQPSVETAYNVSEPNDNLQLLSDNTINIETATVSATKFP